MVRRKENFEVGSFKKLITLLSDGSFHSGAALGTALGLTRSAIWKLIQQFPAWDIPIESVTGKGYRIPSGLSLLNKDTIQNYLSAANQIIPIEIWDSLPSTNDYLMQQLSDKTKRTPRCCLAERQTRGKGRRGRHWVSPFARNIHLSLLWHFPCDVSELSTISLVAAIAIVRTLQSLGITQTLGLKWPNDVLWQGKKLAGVLIELSGETYDISAAVIGIGLNVDMPNASAQKITQAWTDLSEITEKNQLDRNQIAGRLLNELVNSLKLFQEQGFIPFRETWQSLDLTLNKSISIITPTQILQGIGRGINEQGHIRLELENGDIKAFSSGEVSVAMAS